MPLEQQIELGKAAYIHSLVYEPVNQTLAISFMRCDNWDVYGTLTFTDVYDYRFDFDTHQDREEITSGVLIDGLIGIEEMGMGHNPNYIVKTYARELAFNTKSTPIWLPATKQK